MSTPCLSCKHHNTPYCTEPCASFKKWQENPAAYEEACQQEELPAGVFWVNLDLFRDDVCAQDCMDLTRSMRVRSDRKMSDVDEELRHSWLPKGYNWKGGHRTGTAGEYVAHSSYHRGSLHYTHR